MNYFYLATAPDQPKTPLVYVAVTGLDVTILGEKCPNTEFFLVRIFFFRTEYRKIQTRNNSVFGHFLRSEKLSYLDRNLLYLSKKRKQILALFCKLVSQILSQSCVRGLRVAKIVKEIKF